MADKSKNNLANDFIVVWLDRNIENNRNHQDAKVLLRQLVRGNLLTFDDPDKCIDDITDEPIKRVFLIVSHAFGRHVIPNIQVIYIYCGKLQAAEAWAKPYAKMYDEDLPMSGFHLAERENTLQQLTNEMATFIWYHLILIVVRLMTNYGNSKDKVITESRVSYYHDAAKQMKINYFEQNYSPMRAFWWYTCDSFLHQYLDTHSSIMDHQLTVYRGKRLSITELDLFKNNVNELISMNSFLSATLNQNVAILFADATDQWNESSQLQAVLFTSDINNMSNKEMTPFAILKSYSCSPDNNEEEVLFTIGTSFKVHLVE
ncbi:unnamed protein product [Rotaria sp. Silwood2]|nr:unnamed protein product [Rotaria sp. Silwood2]CAF4487210.1 unnamed protein product [Rotaria sp. Silwood2]